MNELKIEHCPATLKIGHTTYSTAALKRIFGGKKVSHILPYNSPAQDELTESLFEENQQRVSISGVQEKFSVVLDKNKLRLTNDGEQGQYILKPIPSVGKNSDFMPANEHLTMQLAKQVFGITTAENALIFFQDGSPAYITKRFDVDEIGTKKAQEDFAALAGRTPQTHGEHYKYLGNYLELFHLLKRFVPAYPAEAPKLFKLLVFNYLFSNGDAHFKNFSLIETGFGDFMLSPAYDLLNSRIHINDKDFALNDGLLPLSETKGNLRIQFLNLGKKAGISDKQINSILNQFTSNSEKIGDFINRSFLSESLKRNYEQSYYTRVKKLLKT